MSKENVREVQTDHVRVHTVNYAADVSGICSALYELGGLIVMHDASGCNSTFATHDEPRWYDIDSMIYISGLTEYDAVLGDDEKYISDVVEIAMERHPKFIAVFGSPVALVMGTDFKGIAHIIEKRTGIPTFWFKTSGMYTYLEGARQAFGKIAELVHEPAADSYGALKINIIGVTPLDFSVIGNDLALRQFAKSHGFTLTSFWAMGDSLEKLQQAASADVNLIVSSTGIDAAKKLRERFGTPYVVGIPMGMAADEKLSDLIHTAAKDKENHLLWEEDMEAADLLPADEDAIEAFRKELVSEKADEFAPGRIDGISESAKITGTTIILGESVFSASLRFMLKHEFGQKHVHVICPLEDSCNLLGNCDILCAEERDIKQLANLCDVFIADPVWGNVLEESATFIPFPTEAYSGRVFRNDIPVFAQPDFSDWEGFSVYITRGYDD